MSALVFPIAPFAAGYLFSVSRIHRRAYLEPTTRTQRHEEEQRLQVLRFGEVRFLRVLRAILRALVVKSGSGVQLRGSVVQPKALPRRSPRARRRTEATGFGVRRSQIPSCPWCYPSFLGGEERSGCTTSRWGLSATSAARNCSPPHPRPSLTWGRGSNSDTDSLADSVCALWVSAVNKCAAGIRLCPPGRRFGGPSSHRLLDANA